MSSAQCAWRCGCLGSGSRPAGARTQSPLACGNLVSRPACACQHVHVPALAKEDGSWEVGANTAAPSQGCGRRSWRRCSQWRAGGNARVSAACRAGSEFEEMFVGVGSRRMRNLFGAAKKKAPCIVFIDEIDAIGGSRKQWESHTRKTLNQLLVEMDGFEVSGAPAAAAAVTRRSTAPPAALRSSCQAIQGGVRV
jgi:ATPase family associated with various cellular activities (AAA)